MKKQRMTEQMAVRMTAETRVKLDKRARKEKQKPTAVARGLIEKGLDNGQ